MTKNGNIWFRNLPCTYPLLLPPAFDFYLNSKVKKHELLGHCMGYVPVNKNVFAMRCYVPNLDPTYMKQKLTKLDSSSLRQWSLLAVGLAGAIPFVHAQDDEIFELSPFTVESSDDSGYRASNTLAGGRLKTQLKDIGSSVEVVTKDFLNDIGATDIQEILQYTTSGEVGGEQGNFVGSSSNATNGDINNTGARRNPSGNTRIRGIGSPDRVRNYYKTIIPLDSYNVERIDINRGSNSLLFGLGSPAGLVNSGLARANFKDSNKVTLGVGSGGDDPSLRASIDLNRVLVDDVLAVRVMGLKNDKKYRQNPTYKDDERYFGAFTFKPFKEAGPTVRGYIESGTIEGNPVDTLLPKQSFDTFVKLRLPIDPYENLQLFGDSSGPDQEQWDALSPEDQAKYYPIDSQGQGVVGRTAAWGYNIVYDGSNGADGGWWYQSDFSGQMFLEGNDFWDPNGIDPPENNLRYGGTPLAQSYKNANNLNYTVDGETRERGQGWTQYGFTNLDTFDFTKQLFAGESDYIRTEFDNYNLSIEQLFLDGNAGFEIGFDSQEVSRTAFTNFGGWNGSFEIDVNKTLLLPKLDANGDILKDENGVIVPEARDNPNFGRPYYLSTSNRDNRLDERKSTRLTAFFMHDFGKNDGFTKWFGQHKISALADEYTEEYRSFNDQLSNFSDDFNLGWHIGHSGAPAPTHTYRRTSSVVYLGPSIQSYIDDPFNPATPLSVSDIRIEASDYNLLVDSPISQSMTYWSRGADADAELRDPNAKPNALTAPGRYLTNGDEEWKQGNVTAQWIPTTNNTARFTEVRSWAINDQSFFFNNHLVANIGYREDVVENWLNSTTRNNDSGVPIVSREDFTYLDGKYTKIDGGPDGSGSFGYGGVLHLPRELLRMPSWLNMSVHYNFSKNFVPDATRESFDEDIMLAPVPSPEGESTDFGFTLDLFESKVIARLNWYENSVLNAPNGLGSLFNRFLGQTHRFYHETQRDRVDLDQDGDGMLDAEFDPEEYPNFARAMDANERYRAILDKGYLQAEIEQGKTELNDDGTLTKSQPWLSNLHDTQDVSAKGFEANITYNPMRNWRMQFNVARQETKTANVGPAMTRIVDDILPIYLDTADLSYWNPSKEARGLLVSGGRVGGDIRNYFKVKRLEGQDNPEVREWRMNAVTNYSFREGPLKGFQLGGAARWQSSGVIGYELMNYAVDPNRPDQTILIDNLDAAYESEEQLNVDLKFGYSRKIMEGRVGWDLRLNLKNVNNWDSDDLSVIDVQPDGTTARVRFDPPLTWELTSSFKF